MFSVLMKRLKSSTRAKKICRKFGGTGNCRHVRRCLRTTICEGSNVLEPRLARIWIGTLGVRQPQRDVIPLDHTTIGLLAGVY